MASRINTAIVREAFDRRGYTVPGDYKWTHQNAPIPYEHRPCGRRHQISWRTFKAGRGCPRCANVESPSTDYVREMYAAKGFVVPANFAYVNGHEPIPYACRKCGNDHATSWQNFCDG